MATPKRAVDIFESFRADPEYRQAEEDLRPNLIIADNVLRRRLQLNISQETLAHMAGMRQPRIADIEGAKGNPRLSTLARLADALDMELSDLVREDSTGLPIVQSVTLRFVSHDAMPVYQDPVLRRIYSQENGDGTFLMEEDVA